MHPKVGPVSCDVLLTNWVAHDLHHIRQWINVRYAHLAANSTVPLDHADTWWIGSGSAGGRGLPNGPRMEEMKHSRQCDHGYRRSQQIRPHQKQ